jgi:pimeloyl-ACP methyl ester carboxylesterase
MQLHHRVVSASGSHPTRWLLVTHGIFGAGRNWASVAKRFVEARPEWGAVLVDLRQHGQSQGFVPPHTLEACARDLALLVADLELPVRGVLGHSFGGKVALVYSRDPATPLEHVWVVDSTPDVRTPSGSAWAMLDVLRDHPGPFTDRGGGVRAVRVAGFPTSVAQWMSTNLVHGPDGYRWRLDPGDMESLLRSFFSTDAWDASTILNEAASSRVEMAGERTGQVFLHPVAGGHWVNADNPDALQALLIGHMS